MRGGVQKRRSAVRQRTVRTGSIQRVAFAAGFGLVI